jgi:Mg2+-importing ATPase
MMWFVFGANTPEAQTLFQSGWFIVGLLTQTLIVHLIRTPKIPFFQSHASTPLMVMTGIIMAVGIFLPMGRWRTTSNFNPYRLCFSCFYP